ncbi:MAG TPA: hypothetical protein VK559_08440 [Ferruginibacter sp.]|nr:hypothetical protein [Ferruginibacter sp.]
MKKTTENLPSQLEIFNNYVYELNDLGGCLKSLKRLVKELRSYLKKLDPNKYEVIIEHLRHNVDVTVRMSEIDFGTNDSCRFARSKQEVDFILKNIIKDARVEIDKTKIVYVHHRELSI